MRAGFFVLLAKLQAMLFGRSRDDREFAQELESHLELAAQENLRRGLPPEEAHRLARLEVGGVTLRREEHREQLGFSALDDLWRDLTLGARNLRRNPGFAVASVATLALGLGANTVIFGLINTVFLRPLPYPEPDRLVNVWRTQVAEPEDLSITSAPNFHDWERENHVFSQMALFDSAGKGYNLSADGEPERVPGLRVSASLFPVLGVQPYLGRTFTREEETQGRHWVVVLGYPLWQRRYGGNRSIVGQPVRIDGQTYTVVGVMPAGFGFEFFSGRNELWVPAGFDEADRERGSNSFGVCARLKAGVTLEQARREMDLIGRRLAGTFPGTNGGETVAVTPMAELGVKEVQPVFTAVFALVGLVLLIACVNVSSLMLARGAAREKEFALRLALGAARTRVVRQLLTESVLLSMVGAVAGLAAAAGCTRLLERVLPRFVQLPFRRLDNVGMDTAVFAFAFLLCGIAGLLFGLVSAYGVLRASGVNRALQEGRGRGGSGRSGWLRQSLVGAEVALALAVLVGAGLMIESLARLGAVDPGLDPKNVLVMSISLPQKVLYTSPPDKPAFCRDLSERVGAIPGVVSVGAISHLPIGGGNAGRGFVIQGQADPGTDRQPSAAYGLACPDYFRSMGIPLVAGRDFSHEDTVSSPGVVIVNQALVQRYLKGTDPVGMRIKIGRFGSANPWLTVVGVTRDIRHGGLDSRAGPHFYRPYTQAAWPFMTVVVKTAASPLALAPPVKRALLAIDRDQAASGIRSMEQVVENWLGSRRLVTLLLAVFGALALMLAAVGISGVVGYSVAQSTHEIGIRMALGARVGDVLRMILSRSMATVLAGLVAGLGAAYVVTRLLIGSLYGVQPMDPKVLAAAAATLAMVALAASYIPARRAARVDPTIALRCE